MLRRASMVMRHIQAQPQTRAHRYCTNKKPTSSSVLNNKPEETIFAKIVSKEMKADIVYEDDMALAFNDINPTAPHHILVIPKKPIGGMSALTSDDKTIIGHCMFVASQVAKTKGLDKTGYRTVVNDGPDGQQTVRWFHIHVIGGRKMSWPPG
mmetsp:Transcript_1305/g.1475  ORF Transcript_1305/g.1475 Transcript_1305/m.1475 type:complete len:153 (-) Transcript_1305:55-513(-)